jgi:hypothetical protein
MELIKTKKDLLLALIFVGCAFFIVHYNQSQRKPTVKYQPYEATEQLKSDVKACSKAGFEQEQIVDCFNERIRKRIQEEQQREEENLF